MERTEMASRCFDYLKTEGYVPEIDGDGDVRFKREGLHYLIIIDAKDENYFRMALPNFWRSSDDASRREALDAINETTGSVKVAKVVMSSTGSVSVYVELFVSGADEATKVMGRCMSAASAAARIFLEKMQT
jgi:hypothetical protein